MSEFDHLQQLHAEPTQQNTIIEQVRELINRHVALTENRTGYQVNGEKVHIDKSSAKVQLEPYMRTGGVRIKMDETGTINPHASELRPFSIVNPQDLLIGALGARLVTESSGSNPRYVVKYKTLPEPPNPEQTYMWETPVNLYVSPEQLQALALGCANQMNLTQRNEGNQEFLNAQALYNLSREVNALSPTIPIGAHYVAAMTRAQIDAAQQTAVGNNIYPNTTATELPRI